MKIIGNLVGLIALALFFISFQCKNKKKLIIFQSCGTTMACLQYLLIGAYSGFALNLVCIIRNLFFFYRDTKKISSPLIPIIFTMAIPAVSLFSWDGPISVFIVAGLAINTFCFGLFSPQGVRKSILVTSPLVIIYNLFTQTYSGVLNETVVIISAILGIIRFCREQKLTDGQK